MSSVYSIIVEGSHQQVWSLGMTVMTVNYITLSLARQTLVGIALSFTHELSFFFVNPLCSAATHDGHQMYFGGSVVAKASTIGIRISPAPPLIFTGVKKCEIWRPLKYH